MSGVGGHELLDYDPALYDPPADLSIYQRGDIIRSEIETGMDQSIVLGATTYRVMYLSEGALGQPIGAVALMAVPPDETPAGGWDMAVWAHGSIGVGDNCAPSKWPHLYEGPWTGYGMPLKGFLLDGYLTVAVDFEGLGTPGNHTYVNARSGANTIIDAAKAARQLGYATSGRFAVFGHSAGSHTARATNVLATAEILGDMELVGTVEANNALNTPEDVYDLMIGASLHPLGGGANYLAWMAHGIQAINPDFDPANLLGPILLDLFDEAEVQCWEELNANFSPQDVGGDDYLNPNFASDPDVQAYAEAIVFGMDGVGSNAPVLVINATGDGLFQVDDMYTLGDNLCAAGVEVENLVLMGKTHDYITYGGMHIVRSWIADRFAGEPVNTTCGE